MIKRVVEYRTARVLIDEGGRAIVGFFPLMKALVKEFYKLPEDATTTGKKIQAITGMIFLTALFLFPVGLLIYAFVVFLKNNITW